MSRVKEAMAKAKRRDPMMAALDRANGVVSPEHALVRAVDLVSRIRAASTAPKVDTPFPRLDEALGGGLRVRTITSIVSGVGAGKSSLALMFGAFHARTSPVFYLGLEIALEQLGARVVGQLLGRSWVEVMDGDVSDIDMRRALEPLDLSFLPRCQDPLGAIVDALAQVRRRMVAGQVAMLIVDYAQLLADLAASGGDFRIATHEAIRQLREIVEAAPDLVCILVSQSSRAGARQLAEGSANAADLIGTGAESSAIEQASANLINLSFTPKDGATTHEVTANISKARFGTRGKVGLQFDGPTGRWTEMDHAPTSAADLRMAEQIIASVRAGAGEFLSKNQILDREGHKVSGNRKAALAMVTRLANEGVFEERNGVFRWR